MRFLVDVCVGRSLANWLQENGHDVISVRDRDPKMSDEAILHWGFSDDRIIITLDKDFGFLSVYKQIPHPGIIRLPSVPAFKFQEITKRILAHHAHDLESRSIITVRGERIRIRRKE